MIERDFSNLYKLLGWAICKLTKHRRGKPLKPTDPPHVPGGQNVKRFQCPRCGDIWTRKIRKPKVV